MRLTNQAVPEHGGRDKPNPVQMFVILKSMRDLDVQAKIVDTSRGDECVRNAVAMVINDADMFSSLY